MKLDDVTLIGVVGAGQMGRGIAQVCAAAGYAVRLVDANPEALKEAVTHIGMSLARAVERGTLQAADAARIPCRIETTSDVDRLRDVQLVIEAVPEDVALKESLFTHLGSLCSPTTILASNTSSISITRLAAASRRPDRVVGLHFMNPPPVMRLVEIIRGRETSDETMAVAVDLTARLGKTAVRSNDVPGFLVNRVLMPMINEAIFALEAGVGTAEDIDAALTAGANHPVGPLALADRIGLDTVLAICEVMERDLHDPKFRPCPLLRRYVEAGWLGRKSGRGFYDYADRPVESASTVTARPREGVIHG